MRQNPSADAPLMLTVSGVRGIVDRSMTDEVAARFAGAFGSHVRINTKCESPTLCVGRDSRPSGERFMDAAMNGFIDAGCRVIDLGVVATPTVGVMIDEHAALGGLVVTASHNPIQWNGLKCLNADGVAPPPEMAGEIIDRYTTGRVDEVASKNRGAIEHDASANEIHVARVLKDLDVECIRRSGTRVVLDSINGAGCVSGRMLLEALGCDLVHLNGEPTGEFAHTPEPTETNLVDLARRTSAEGAAVGFAQDPDADRLAIIDETGRYIGEEYTLVLAAKCVLDSLQDSGGGRGGVIAANLSTSRMIDDLVAGYEGVEVVRTAVGEANVVAALKAAGDRAIMGGEGNGGVIVPEVCWVRDSLSAMALVLSLMERESRSLSAIVDELPRYTMIKEKFDLSAVGGIDAVGPMLAKVRAHFAGARINDIDGIRIDLDHGWVHLRPSNTEPIIRLIAEAKSESRVRALIDEVVRVSGIIKNKA